MAYGFAFAVLYTINRILFDGNLFEQLWQWPMALVYCSALILYGLLVKTLFLSLERDKQKDNT